MLQRRTLTRISSVATDSFTIDFSLDAKDIESRLLEVQKRLRVGAKHLGAQNSEFTTKTLPSIIRQNFVQKGRPKWVPRKDKNPWPLLVKHGEMFEAAMRPISIPGFAGINRVAWAANVGVVGIAHQYGWKGNQTVKLGADVFGRGAKKSFKRKMDIPARPFFVLPPDGSAEREFSRQLSKFAIEPFEKRDYVSAPERVRAGSIVASGLFNRGRNGK